MLADWVGRSSGVSTRRRLRRRRRLVANVAQSRVEYCFGERLWVVPRDARRRHDGASAVLRLDPGLAFGTGGHATTAMCLDWIASREIDGWSVVDYGAGSGILGIAALLLGAAHVVAVDHDEQARLATRANATYNGIASQRLRIVEPDELATVPHDLVLANILAGPLMALAPVLDSVGQTGRPAGDVGNARAPTRRGVGDVIRSFALRRRG